MKKCSFCAAKVPDSMELPCGWGYAKLTFDNKVTELRFCPKHRNEAKEKLDLVLSNKKGGELNV